MLALATAAEPYCSAAPYEAAAVVPQRAELWLLEALARRRRRGRGRCVSARMLVARTTGFFPSRVRPSQPGGSVGPGEQSWLHRQALRASHFRSAGPRFRFRWPGPPRRGVRGRRRCRPLRPRPAAERASRWAPTGRPWPSTGGSSGPGPGCPLDSARPLTVEPTFARVLPDRPER